MRGLDGAQEAVKVALPVGAVVEIQRGDPQLEKAPEGFAQVGGEAHQVQVGQVASLYLSEILLQQEFAALLFEHLIDGVVAQVEKEIAHARVLPVQDIDGLLIFEEV